MVRNLFHQQTSSRRGGQPEIGCEGMRFPLGLSSDELFHVLSTEAQ